MNMIQHSNQNESCKMQKGAIKQLILQIYKPLFPTTYLFAN